MDCTHVSPWRQAERKTMRLARKRSCRHLLSTRFWLMRTNSIYDGDPPTKKRCSGSGFSCNTLRHSFGGHPTAVHDRRGVELKAFVDDVHAALPQLTPTAVVVMSPLREQLRDIGSSSMSRKWSPHYTGPRCYRREIRHACWY